MNKILFIIPAILVAMPLQAAEEYPSADELVSRLGIRESAIASREMPGWSRPDKVTIMSGEDLPPEGPGSEQWLREVSDGVDFAFVDPTEEGHDRKRLADSDVYVGWCYADDIAAASEIDYIHIFSAGLDRCVAIPELMELKPIATNGAKTGAEAIAEHSIALMLSLTRNLHAYHSAQLRAKWRDDEMNVPRAQAVQGKTMLVLGLGSIGSQVARRAHDLGMRVLGTRNSSRSGPDYVDYVGLSDEMVTLAGKADVIVNALPLTPGTRGIIDADFFAGTKDGAIYISVGRGATTDTDALMAALESGELRGAGLDVTDPEPLPEDHPLWALPNVLITPHMAGQSELSTRNRWIIARENLRRYIRGEKLLNPVDLERGY
jgi:phosphoglycerate dehydrogenase-like enzyme